jgi:LAO/AO transport system kinase
VETVGVGQSEIEIAGLADITIVTIVPEAGDEIQTMKAGLMEIADIFVVNKSDRPGADIFVKNLKQMLAPAFSNHEEEIQVIKTIASQNEGVTELKMAIDKLTGKSNKERKAWLLAEKAWQLIQNHKMSGLSKEKIQEDIQNAENINLHRFIRKYL